MFREDDSGKSMSSERKLQFQEEDISSDRGAPLLPCLFQSRYFSSYFMLQGFFIGGFPIMKITSYPTLVISKSYETLFTLLN
jgi:hypothetical protein